MLIACEEKWIQSPKIIFSLLHAIPHEGYLCFVSGANYSVQWNTTKWEHLKASALFHFEISYLWMSVEKFKRYLC